MTKTLDDLLTQVEIGKATVFDVERSADGKTQIIFGQRALQPEPPTESKIARRKARCHTFFDIVAFGDYLRRETTLGDNADDCLVLADPTTRHIQAVFKDTADTDQETVTFYAAFHPLFEPWRALLNRPVSVVDFGQFILKNRRVVLADDPRELAYTFLQITTSKAVTIREGVGAKSINGVMVELSIQGERKGVPVELPETLQVNLPLFMGAPAQTLDFDLLVTASPKSNDESPVVFMTSPAIAEAEALAFDAMATNLREDTGLLVGLGKIAHRDWAIVGK